MKGASSTLLFLVLLIKSITCFSQAGNLDITFGTKGIGSFVFQGTTEGIAYSETIQPDGKIIIGGNVIPANSDPVFTLARYNSNGSLDSSFGIDGQVAVNSNLYDNAGGGYVALQADGKIVLGGEYYRSFALLRFNANGSLDSTFNGSGIKVTNFNNAGNPDQGGPVAIQADGKIVQIGHTAILGSGGVWTGIENWEVVRYNTDGSLDNTFGTGGIVYSSFINPDSYPTGVLIQPDEKIVVGGSSSQPASPPTCFALARYNSNGSLDSSFSVDGKFTLYFGSGTSGENYDEDECWSIGLQADGKIIMAGYSELGSDSVSIPLRFARVNSNGILDSSFGINGKEIIAMPSNGLLVNSICPQPDGKIILAGSGEKLCLSRFNYDGSIDSSFGKNGFVFTSIGTDTNCVILFSIALQSDGKIVGAGIGDGMLVLRYLSGLNTGILNFSSPQNPLLIYPNPINKQATLQYSLTQNESISLTLTDMLGRQEQTFFTNQARTQGEHKEELQLANTLAAGNYILTISNGHSSQGVKVAVVR